MKFDRFGKNIAQLEGKHADYFLLVTNTSITPYSHYCTQHALASDSVPFSLMDEFLLRRVFGQPVDEQPIAPIAIEYQTKGIVSHRTQGVDVYLTARNCTGESRACQMELQSDLDWSMDCPRLDLYLEPYEIQSRKLKAVRRHLDTSPHVRIRIGIDGQYEILTIDHPEISYNFVPPLFGSNHIQIVTDLAKELNAASLPSVVHIAGPAGVGKSRVLEEALDRAGTSLNDIHTFIVDGQTDIDDVLKAVAQRKGTLPGDTGADSLFRDIVVLEDFHYASELLCQQLRDFITSDENPSNTTFVITGRSDDTHTNDYYFTLAEWFRVFTGKSSIQQYDVRPLSDRDSRKLIQTIVKDIPPVALDRIQRLADNIPFNIVQAIEYLLDTKLVSLINRNTVGVTRTRRFHLRDAIPSGIMDVLKLRLESLRALPQGDLLASFLMVAARSGQQFPEEWAISWFRKRGILSDLEILIERRFLNQTLDGQLKYHHENIYNYCRTAFDGDHDPALAQLAIQSDEFFTQLADEHKGFIFLKAGDHASSRQCFSKLQALLQEAGDLSALRLRRDDVDHLLHLAALEAEVRIHDHLRLKCLVARAYIATHHLPLMTAVRICDEALAELQSDETAGFRHFEMEVLQLKAHSLQNVGHLSAAQKIMLELDVSLRVSADKSSPGLRFDLYDRLQDIYVKMNYRAVARHFNALSKDVARQEGLVQLHCLASTSEANIELYLNPSLAQELYEEAHAIGLEHSLWRNATHAKLSVNVASVLRQNADFGDLALTLKSTQEILQESLRQNFTYTVTRSQMLISVVYLLLASHSKGAESENLSLSIRYAKMAINSSFQFGTGSYIWQAYCVLATAYARRGYATSSVAEQFASAIAHIESQDLFFIGATDLCYPNILVLSNYVRFLLSNGTESQLMQFSGRLSWYESNQLTALEKYAEVKRRVSESGSLSSDAIEHALVDQSTGYLIPIC